MKQFLIRIEHIAGSLSSTTELCWCSENHANAALLKAIREYPDAICTLARDNQGQLITRIV